MTCNLFEKPRRKVDCVHIHCSASDRPEDDDVRVMRRWHKARGWKDIGYHFFIRKDGMVQFGRDLELTPASAKGYNRGAIAICCHGLDESKFTQLQFDALRHLCDEINLAYSIRFRGHNEMTVLKTCPVFKYKVVLNLNDQGHMTTTVKE